MKYVRVVIFIIISLISIPIIADASVPVGGADLLQIRAGEHSGFLRIVLEGRSSTISEGRVSQKGKDIIVRFTGRNFEIKKTGVSVAYRTDRDTVIFTLKQAGKLKSYSLQDPSRFVIDVYPEEEIEKKQANIETKPEVERNQRIKPGTVPAVSSNEHSAAKKMGAAANPGKVFDEKRLIPEKYKEMWALLDSGNFYAVLKAIPGHKPENAESLAALNYIYARVSVLAKQHLDAVKYLRLAYIYATDSALKELALLKRGGLYLELKLYYEARADYIVFIRDFPSSEYIEKAHYGLAESLYKIGSYQEAIENYRKSGSSVWVLYGMANAMQRLEMVQEAKKAYDQAILIDKTFIKSSPETVYLIGENMRMSGDMVNAKITLSQIESGTYRDNAIISLGLIAMEESEMQEAVRRFKTVASARDQRVKVQALFNLALAYLKEGNYKEATSSLEEIRYNHIDSNMYKEAVLALAKIYKKGGRVKESLSLLKELVYGKQPPAEAFNVLEEIVLETGAGPSQDGLTLAKLWSEVGMWLVDRNREEFLLKVAGRLRHEGTPFIELCSWLVENASERARARAAIDLAGYYIGIGSTDLSRNYINIARNSRGTGDGSSRVEARILDSEGEPIAALKQILMIKDTEMGDLSILGSLISKINDPGMKEVQRAMAYYERKLNEGEWDAESYIHFADILYMNNDSNKALKYYRIAAEKNPDNEWVMYRVARDTERPEARDMFSRLEKGDNIYGRLAKSKLMEMSLLNKVREVY